MGQLTIKGRFELSQVQAEILQKNSVSLEHKFIPQEGGKYAHWESVFSWEGKEPPLTQDILCYEDDQWPDPLPKGLAQKSHRRETINHTTTGLSGTKD